MPLTDFMNAVNLSDVDEVKRLLETNSDAIKRDNPASLIMAAERGDSEVAILLIRAGFNIDYKTEGGETALIAALRMGHAKMVNFLLEQGIDQQAECFPGVTPLFFAFTKIEAITVDQQSECLFYLLKRAALSDVENIFSNITPLATLLEKLARFLSCHELMKSNELEQLQGYLQFLQSNVIKAITQHMPDLSKTLIAKACEELVKKIHAKTLPEPSLPITLSEDPRERALQMIERAYYGFKDKAPEIFAIGLVEAYQKGHLAFTSLYFQYQHMSSEHQSLVVKAIAAQGAIELCQVLIEKDDYLLVVDVILQLPTEHHVKFFTQFKDRLTKYDVARLLKLPEVMAEYMRSRPEHLDNNLFYEIARSGDAALCSAFVSAYPGDFTVDILQQALFCAIDGACEHKEVVTQLLSVLNKFDKPTRDFFCKNHSFSLTSKAIKNGFVYITQQLFTVCIKDKMNKLFNLAIYGDHTNVVQLFIRIKHINPGPQLDTIRNVSIAALYLDMFGEKVETSLEIPNLKFAKGLYSINHDAALQLVRENNIVLLSQFLACGKNINAQNNLGVTLLHLAAHCGHVYLIKILLKCSARQDLTCLNGGIARDLAIRNGNTKVIDCFTEAPPGKVYSSVITLDDACRKGQAFDIWGHIKDNKGQAFAILNTVATTLITDEETRLTIVKILFESGKRDLPYQETALRDTEKQLMIDYSRDGLESCNKDHLNAFFKIRLTEPVENVDKGTQEAMIYFHTALSFAVKKKLSALVEVLLPYSTTTLMSYVYQVRQSGAGDPEVLRFIPIGIAICNHDVASVRLLIQGTPAYLETALECALKEEKNDEPLREIIFLLLKAKASINHKALEYAACHGSHEIVAELLTLVTDSSGSKITLLRHAMTRADEDRDIAMKILLSMTNVEFADYEKEAEKLSDTRRVRSVNWRDYLLNLYGDGKNTEVNLRIQQILLASASNPQSAIRVLLSRPTAPIVEASSVPAAKESSRQKKISGSLNGADEVRSTDAADAPLLQRAAALTNARFDAMCSALSITPVVETAHAAFFKGTRKEGGAHGAGVAEAKASEVVIKWRKQMEKAPPGDRSGLLHAELIKAAKESDIELVAEVVRYYGIYKISLDPVLGDALRTAADAGRCDIISYFLTRGVDINSASNGTTALHLAASSGHVDAVKLLLEKGADIGVKLTETHETALDVASKDDVKAVLREAERKHRWSSRAPGGIF